MKELDDLVFPDDRRYAEDHEWAREEDGRVRVGVSDYAQDQLGDVVYVELPEVGVTLDRGESFGTVESVKAVSELYLPFRGEVVAVNEALADAPERVNESPYEEGWMILAVPEDPAALDALLSRDAYRELLRGKG